MLNRARAPRAIAASLALLAASACSGDDAGGPPDAASTPADAGATNADLGASDMGAPDLGAPDAGMMSCPILGAPLGDGIAPDRRDDVASAYDPVCGRVFMFFGDQGVPMNCGFSAATFANEVFVYDVGRQAWSQLSPGNEGPVPADRAGAIWDAQRERVVVFGGRYRAVRTDPYGYPRDIWAYDVASNQWERLLAAGRTGPTGRMDFIMVADPTRDRFLVSHGGQFAPNLSSFVVFDDTWAFDLATNSWSEVDGGQVTPPGRVYPAGALDESRQQLWVFSGSGTDAFVAPARLEMWVLDIPSARWSEVTPQQGWPEARFNAPMIWDEARDRLVMFGGHDNSSLGNNNDLWAFELGSRTWTLLREGDTFNKPEIGFCDFPGDFVNADLGSPERRAAHLFVKAGPDTAITYGGNTDCGLANDTWALDLATDTWAEITVSPSGMTCPRSGNPNCTDPSARMCD